MRAVSRCQLGSPAITAIRAGGAQAVPPLAGGLSVSRASHSARRTSTQSAQQGRRTLSASRPRSAALQSSVWPAGRASSLGSYRNSDNPVPSPQWRRQYSTRLPGPELHAVATDHTHHRAYTSSVDAPEGPAELYAERVKTGELRRDEYQLTIVQDLEKLYRGLLNYEAPPVPDPLVESKASSRTGWMGKLFGNSERAAPSIPDIPEDVPKSLYLFGDVGCGKSMLMDLFYETLPEEMPKRRVHFHAFMIDVHKRLHRLSAQEGNASKGDAIVPVARELARESRVLCFDEFQVTDIADAMILRRLLESLIGYGFVVVITSNRKPDDLYKNGIQRSSFIPCIDLINERFVVRDLDSPTDYRRLPRALSKVYYHPISEETKLEFDKLFDGLTADTPITTSTTLNVWGRKLAIPKAAAKVAYFTFADLCGRSLSAADYLEIVRNFDTIFIDEIPQLTLNERDRARRFILFIDAAYESKTKLFTLSEVPITQIFSDKKGTSSAEEMSAHQRSMMDDLGLNAETVGASSIFTGDEEVFAFARAVSRLSEMGSKAWANRARAGG